MSFKCILILALILTVSLFKAQQSSSDKIFSIYWCGFSEGFCGQSKENDVYPLATHIILAYSKINSDGEFSTGNFDLKVQNLVQNWKKEGKKVLLSVNGEISLAFKRANKFGAEIKSVLERFQLDGVDFSIKGFQESGEEIVEGLKEYRNTLGKNYLIFVTCESIGVVPGQQESQENQENWESQENQENQEKNKNNKNQDNQDKQENEEFNFNFMVPVVRESRDFDYIQVLFYGREYLGEEKGSVGYILSVYKGWLNQLEGFKIQNFDGIEESKLIVGVLASWEADVENSSYYFTPWVLVQAFEELVSEGYNPCGINIWNSFYDNRNNNTISKTIVQTLDIEVNEQGQNGQEEENEEILQNQDNQNNFGDDFKNDGEDMIGTCYIIECGCPESFQIDWCGYQNKPLADFCQSGPNQCQNCNGIWCGSFQDGEQKEEDNQEDENQEENNQEDNQESGICYYQECGCPRDFKEPWCSAESRLQSSWCNLNQEQCELCNGSWCEIEEDINGTDNDKQGDNNDQDQEEKDGSIDGSINKFRLCAFVFVIIQLLI